MLRALFLGQYNMLYVLEILSGHDKNSGLNENVCIMWDGFCFITGDSKLWDEKGGGRRIFLINKMVFYATKWRLGGIGRGKAN